MFKKIKNIFFLLVFFVSIFIIIKHYISEQNIIFTNKSRATYLITLGNVEDNLPTLKNDTDNAIVYIDDLEYFKKKRKKRFWEKLISNKNEY